MNIYDFTDVTEFLKAVWLERKNHRSGYSIRMWAKELKLSFHNVLYEITRGSRQVPTSYVPLLISNLNLDDESASYFEAMVSLQKSKTELEQKMYLERLEKIKKKQKIDFQVLDEHRLVEDPLHLMILEMSVLEQFSADAGWIRQELKIERSTEEIEQAIAILIHLGLLVRKSDGNLCKNNKHLTSKNDIPNKIIQNYHKEMLSIAAEQISRQDVNDREFASYMLNIKKEAVPKAKELIRDFVRHFMNEIECESYTGEETYNLGMQFFSLTGNEK